MKRFNYLGQRAASPQSFQALIARHHAFRPRQLEANTGCYLARRCYAVDLRSLDIKWRQKWQEGEHTGSSTTGDALSRPSGPKPNYVLPMFPYPSGNLHLGHLRVYTVADVVARYRRLKGDNVVLPMGWDAFGLPAENAALERGIAPEAWTKTNIAKMKEQLQLMNGSWDWNREITTCDPEFYKHTQQLFLMLHSRGLAYQAEAEVNYDPVDKTVLANEQVDANGCSWRSGAKVEKKTLKQWFFKTSEYREALLRDLDDLLRDNNWPEHVISQQKSWLGKSSGALVKFPLMVYGGAVPDAAIEVFTTRPDTLFGVQYIALAASHPLVKQLARADGELQAFLDTIPGLPPDAKVGWLLPQLRAINPLAYHDETPEATKASLPVYVAPYVLGDYGEGAVMGVPGHDVRDHSFWKTHQADHPVRLVLAPTEDEALTVFSNVEPFVAPGVMTHHSGAYKGKSSQEAGKMIVHMLETAGLAKVVDKWRLRDWLISRQRYWGTPIPIIHCTACGAVPVPEKELPVKLPDASQHWAKGKSGNALESCTEFVNTTCPKCNGPARRDTDTMDTFVDSSWYYARFADPHNTDELFSSEASKLLPVDTYIGGIEHAILHLLYSRFIYKFLASTPLIPAFTKETWTYAEPFKRLITQGMVHGKTYLNGDTGVFLRPDEVNLSDPSSPQVVATGEPARVTFEKMSKSKHNGVDPTDFINKYGADATRAHMLFQAPVGDVLNWDESKISGVTRWLQRLHDQIVTIAASGDAALATLKGGDFMDKTVRKFPSSDMIKSEHYDADRALWRAVQLSIHSVTQSYNEVYSLNTVISDLMGLTNSLASSKANMSVKREAASTILRLLAPITPAFADECWSILHPLKVSLFESATFPEEDGLLDSDELQPRFEACVVQINGKIRGTVEIPCPPTELEGDSFASWMILRILETETGKAKFSEGRYDLRAAKKAIAIRGSKSLILSVQT